MLRDYQEDICSQVHKAFERHRSVMVQMPTGTGKTVVLASLVGKWEKAKVLIVAHRRELIEQIKATIERMKMDSQNIMVESIQTISRRIDSLGFSPTLVVIDEAHHALAKTYKMMWEALPEAKFLGLTATPCRLNGKGFTDLFDVLLCSLSVPEFIRKGVLAPFDYVAINEDSSQQLLIDSLKKRGTDGDYQVKEMNEVLNKHFPIEQLYDCYEKFAKKKKGIVYAVSIEHARSIAEYYGSRGIKAVAISAKTPANERELRLEEFRMGKVRVLVNVDIFSEGFDCPDVEFIQLARPTLSLAKYLQMVGRGLRSHKDKVCCVILDNVGLLRLFGLPTRCWDWDGWFRGIRELKGEIRNFRLEIRKESGERLGDIFEGKASSEFSLVIGHKQLEELIRDSKLEEWNEERGIIDEGTEAYKDESSRLWGLRRGVRVLVPPTYLSVFNIKEGLAAVRMKDTKLAVVDMSGNVVRNLGKGNVARVCNKDFVEVSRNSNKDYIDLLSGQPYYNLPTIVSQNEPQMIYTAYEGLILRLKDPFVYGRISRGNHFNGSTEDYGFFYVIYLLKNRNELASYAVDANTLVVLKGDNERAYWLYDAHEDGSIDVIDRMGNSYHVMPDGRREKLNRCSILKNSLSVLREISNQYRMNGWKPNDIEEWNFRNEILHRRIFDKLRKARDKS